MSELDLDYRGSSLSEDRPTSASDTRWLPSGAVERADPIDRVRFATGVRAGDRAPDGIVEDAGTGLVARLFDAFRGPHFTLLLFDGDARTADGYVALAEIAAGIERRFGSVTRTWIVVWGRALPAQLAGRRLLFDPGGDVHRSYGATAEALCLVRPDGYVGLRAQPATEEAVVGYLARVLDRAVSEDAPPPPGSPLTSRTVEPR